MSRDGREPIERWPDLAALAIGLALLALHARRYLPLVVDDAYISLRYADRLLAGDGLTWTAGEAVEGYSNLAWTLGLAGLRALGVAPDTAGRVLGGLGAAACLVAVVAWSRRRGPGSAAAAGVAAVLVACAGPLALWSVAGLEGTLFAGLVALAVAGLRPCLDDGAPLAGRRRWGLSLLVAVLTLLRPEGVGVALLLVLLFVDQHPRRREALRAAAPLALLALVTFGLQLAFRWYRYGDWVPNTARAKLSFALPQVLEALAGLEAAAVSASPLLALALIGLGLRGRLSRSTIFVVGLGLAWLGYVLIFGVRMEAQRHLTLLYPLLAMLSADTVMAFARRGTIDTTSRLSARWRRLAMVAVALVVVAFAALQWRDRDLRWLRSHYATRLSARGLAIGRAIRRAFAPQDPLLAVDAAGAIPYAAGTRALDMLGLTDAWIAHHPPPGFGYGLAGHDLGDGDYVLRRAPDILVAGILGEESLSYRTGAQLMHDPRFLERYTRVYLQSAEPFGEPFAAFLRNHGALGEQPMPDGGRRIPAALLAGRRSLTARLTPEGYVLHLEGPTPVELPPPPGPGLWRVHLEGVAGTCVPILVPTEERHVVLHPEGAGDLVALRLTPASW
ncbi:MAG: hypothetical protein R3B72_04335 [Polyangiaceae bacterium]